MSDTTPNLSLPLIAAAQAQKHVTHNEALALIDALAQAAVETMALAAPPEALTEGARYVVAQGATGAWAGRSGEIAIVSGGGFVFHQPKAGFLAYDRAAAKLMLFDGAQWREAAPAGGGGGGGGPPPFPDSVAKLGFNATASDTQRLAVQSRSVLFSHDTGGDAQVQVNRQGAASTGTLVYSTGWSGRAETGLAGSDDYSIKVSPDGAAWREAMVAEAATGRVVLPGGLTALPRPALALGMHMTSPGVIQAAEFVAAAGRFYIAPFIPPSRRLFESAGIRVTIAAAGLARLGLYADTGDYRPGVLLADLGTLDTGVTGLRSATMALTLDPRPYWIGALFQAGPRIFGQQGNVLGLIGSSASAGAAFAAGLWRAQSWAAGLPGDEAAAAYSPGTASSGFPLFYIR
jgi:hypothetical protein